MGVATSTQDVVGETDKAQLMTHVGTAWRVCYIRLDVVKETDEDLFLIIGKVSYEMISTSETLGLSISNSIFRKIPFTLDNRRHDIS